MSRPLPGTEPLEVVVLIGLPAAGKTTLYRQRFAATHVHVSRDLMKGARGPQRQLGLVEEALASRRSVVVDNTNPRCSDRQPFIALARRHGARVLAYWFRSPTAECLARNRVREADARVPAVAIFTAAKRMEAPAPDEGFDGVYTVQVSPGGGFEVTAEALQTTS